MPLISSSGPLHHPQPQNGLNSLAFTSLLSIEFVQLLPGIRTLTFAEVFRISFSVCVCVCVCVDGWCGDTNSSALTPFKFWGVQSLELSGKSDEKPLELAIVVCVARGSGVPFN